MSTASVVVTGLLREDGTLELDEPISLPPGRVRLTVQTEEPLPPAVQSLLDTFAKIRASQEARGFQGRSAEEILAELRAMRDDPAYEAKWEWIYSQTDPPRKDANP